MIKTAIFWTVCTGLALSGAALSSDTKQDTLRMAYCKDVFNEVDVKDAQVALGFWTKELTRELDIFMTVETFITEDFEDIPAFIDAVRADMIAVPSIDYLSLAGRGVLFPLVVGTMGGNVAEELVLLVHRESGISTLAQLKDRIMLVPSSPVTNNLLNRWLEIELYSEKLERQDRFFREVKKVTKPSQAVMPVFFRQADACVVSERAFRTMSELNGQLQNDLVMIQKSPPFLRYVYCRTRYCSKEKENSFLKAAFRAEKSVRGRQTLNLFKLDGVLGFEAGQLITVKKILEQYDRLPAARKGNPKDSR